MRQGHQSNKWNALRIRALTLAAALLSPLAAAAQDLPTAPYLPLDMATTAAQAAVAACAADGRNVSVAIVARSGVTKTVLVADNAGPHTVGSSIGKAFTSASLGRDTTGLAAFIGSTPENDGLRNLDSRLVIQAGGLPIKIAARWSAVSVSVERLRATRTKPAPAKVWMLSAQDNALRPAPARAGQLKLKGNPMRYRFTLAAALALTGVAHAQTAPSAAEIARYCGLHLAAHQGQVDEIVRLIASGADVNARDRAGRTPAHVTAFVSQEAALPALAKSGADMNALENGIYDVLTIAAVADDPEMVSRALALGNGAGLITSVYDGTALIAAAHLGHHEVVARLVAGGAPLNHVNNLGWTALMEAMVLGDGGADQVRTVEILLAAGADRTRPDRDGVTPLQHAQARGYARMLALLK